MTFRGLEIWDLGIIELGFVNLGSWGEAFLRAVKQWVQRNGRRPAHGPSTEGEGTRVFGYAIKNSGLIVEVNRPILHVCVKEPRVKIRSPEGRRRVPRS
jgi:hypothetical protein